MSKTSAERQRAISRGSFVDHRSQQRGNKCVLTSSVPSVVPITTLSLDYYSVRDQERRGLVCPEAANYRLCWQLLLFGTAQTRPKEGERRRSHAHDCQLVCWSRAGQPQREGEVGCSATDSSLLCLMAKCVRSSAGRRWFAEKRNRCGLNGCMGT